MIEPCSALSIPEDVASPTVANTTAALLEECAAPSTTDLSFRLSTSPSAQYINSEDSIQEELTFSSSNDSQSSATSRVDKSIVTLEACVRRPVSCGICKTQHQRPKVVSDGPRAVVREEIGSSRQDRKRRQSGNSALCSTYTLWRFHRLKIQGCSQRNTRDASISLASKLSPVTVELNGASFLEDGMTAVNATRSIALRGDCNSLTLNGEATVSAQSHEATFKLNQTSEQSELPLTPVCVGPSRFKPNISEQKQEQNLRKNFEHCPSGFLACHHGVKSSKLFKKRRKSLTLRMCLSINTSALFQLSKNTENYQQFSKISLINNSSNRRSLIASPAHFSCSVVRVIYVKLTCCEDNTSPAIPVLITYSTPDVLTLEKPLFTKTYNCSYFRHCYRQKYTRRRRRVTSLSRRKSTRIQQDTSSPDDVINLGNRSASEAASTTQDACSHHEQSPKDVFYPTFNHQESGTPSSPSWVNAFLTLILTSIIIVLILVCRESCRLVDRLVFRWHRLSNGFEKSTTGRVRLKRHDFIRSLVCLLLVLSCCSSPVSASFPVDSHRFLRSAPPPSDFNYNETATPRGRICQSIDVRNSVHNLRFLQDCRVIEGFLQIFVEGGTPAEWSSYSFPELVEVTDYVLMYRNTGLKALGALFPNLAIIRGHNLLYNFALVVYESTGIQELGLYHLTDIVRGSVLIQKNPTLCFVDTVDWDLISWTKGGHYIKDNRHPNECPICPLNATGGELCLPSNATPASRPLCVNTTHCQKMCKLNCSRSCYNEDQECCNQACIGGCTGPTTADCIGCRALEYDGRCVEECPPHAFNFIDRRCVTNDECQRQPPPLVSEEETVRHWKFVRNEFTKNNVCVLDCPKGYMERVTQYGKYECQRCSGDCEKHCEGANIESIQTLQRYKECTYIKGSLEIQIQNGANVVKELEDNLGMVEVITGYLKIARSYPIMSLNFFKKLRLIKGEVLETSRYAVVVLDNVNLMELWDWEKRNISMKVERGSIFFHFNPKLCFYHIESFASRAGPLIFTETDAPKSSNGDKAACNITKINASITDILGPTFVTIAWEKFNHYDSRALLSYLIYYKETKYQNVSIYESRDACGGDGWKMEDFEDVENKTPLLSANETKDDKWVVHILNPLKPFTQYAYYVRTYTIATERNGAQSPIQYFRTKPFTPSFPLEVIATTMSSSEIEITWKPPKTPNGNLTHYFIVGYWERDDPKIIETRNYCREPTILSGGGTLVPPTSTPSPVSSTLAPPPSGAPPSGVNTISSKSATSVDDECVCTRENQKTEEDKMKENNRWIEIEFENALQNQVYVKRREPMRRRRDVDSGMEGSRFPDLNNTKPGGQWSRASSDEENQTHLTVPSPAGNVTTPEGVFERFEFVVYGATSFILRNLSHYAKYNIEVQACRESLPDEIFDSQNSNCSRKSLVTRRTAAKDGMDIINQTSFKLEFSNGSWYAHWDPPVNPNGLIVAYRIETARLDKSKYSKPGSNCISKLQYEQDGKHDLLSSEMIAGNYSIRVRAVSLYGDGPWTERLYFVVQKPNMSDVEVAIIAVLFVVILLLICLGVVYYRREKERKMIVDPNPDYIPVYKKDSWEVARSKVTILDELGNGSFGLVCRGLVKDFRSMAELPCAVKLVNENASDRERAEFLNEASVMKAFDTHHVVKLFGVVSEGHPTLVIMELMAAGDLKNYLRSCRPDADNELGRSPPTLKRILQMSSEIADGMAYLADKKYVHRDLAARNCMVADDLTVKVGDFGMTRDIYETEYYRKGSRGFLPVRWMAPESLKDGVFTSQSDVWSYGVVLWEIATLASQPYQGLTNEQVLNWVKGGGILVRPDNCPDRLFNLMRRCWQFKPQVRPTFMQLLADLEPDLNPNFHTVSYYNSEAAQLNKIRNANRSETRTSSTTLDEQIPLRTAQDIEDFSLSSDSEQENDIHAIPQEEPEHNVFPMSELNKPGNCSGLKSLSRYSEDSRAYLDSSRPSTLGRYDTHSNGTAATGTVPESAQTGNCATVPRATPAATGPSYFGASFSTFGGPTASSIPRSGTNVSSLTPSSENNNSSLNPTPGSYVSSLNPTSRNNNCSSIPSTGSHVTGSTPTTGTSVSSLNPSTITHLTSTMPANGHVTGAGLGISNNNNNLHRRNNGAPTNNSSQTSMPC